MAFAVVLWDTLKQQNPSHFAIGACGRMCQLCALGRAVDQGVPYVLAVYADRKAGSGTI